MSRGHFLRLIGKKKKERDTYIWALNNIELKTLEKRDISFMLGIWFIKSKNCSEAITFFDKSFENYHDDFYYKKEFGQILNAYLECDEEEKAKNLLNFFIARKNFDKKFIKLEKKYNFLL